MPPGPIESTDKLNWKLEIDFCFFIFDFAVLRISLNNFSRKQDMFDRESLKSSDNYVAQACEPYPDPYSYGTGQ